MPKTPKKDLTSIQISTGTRDRLYKLKFRKTYDEFLVELCDLYEESLEEEESTRNPHAISSKYFTNEANDDTA